jgi:hypothetical protein
VHFKIQNTVGEHAQIAAYLDARLVFDRLDHVSTAPALNTATYESMNSTEMSWVYARLAAPTEAPRNQAGPPEVRG